MSIMPAYSRLQLVRLRELCALRGILTEGVRKPDLIAALRADDDLYLEDGAADDHAGSERADDRGDQDDVNHQEGHQLSNSDDGEVDFAPARPRSPLSDTLRLKQLELEIEQTKLEQLKLQQSTHSVLPTPLSAVRLQDVQLSSMTDTTDPLSFFACWEKTLFIRL